MVLQQPAIRTVEDFIIYAALPENAARSLEFINGRIVEKMGGTTRNAQIPLLLSALVIAHCESHQLPCYVSGADGAYCLDDWCFIPDFAFKPTPLSEMFPDRVPPLWAVEVISSTENPAEKRRKYIQSGILLWEIYPDERVIDVYPPGQSPASYGLGAAIPVTLIPGLTIETARLFR